MVLVFSGVGANHDCSAEHYGESGDYGAKNCQSCKFAKMLKIFLKWFHSFD